MDIGETLRTAREQRGLSLEALSQTTKIGVPALRAIEGNDIERLPGGIFLRGFLRSYAREVGLDVEETVNRYVAQFESQPVAVEEAAVDAHTLDSPVGTREAQSFEESLREVSWLGLVAIVLLSLGLLAYMTLRQPHTTSDAPVTRVAATPAAPPQALGQIVPASTPGEAGTAGSHEPSATPVQRGNALTLNIETIGPCWVSATVDGDTVIYRLMQEGERQTIQNGNDVVLRVGDPATFTFSLNGAPGKSLGQAGSVATVHITADNYRDFIAGGPTP